MFFMENKVVKTIVFLFIARIVLIRCVSTDNITNYGTKFYITLVEHIVDYSDVTLLMTTDLPNKVNVRISVPLRPDLQTAINTTVKSGEDIKISLNTKLILHRTSLSDKGIFIESDYLISLQVYSQSFLSIFPTTVGGYLAFPLSSLDVDYMVVTYCRVYSCAIGVIATTNNTQVKIVLRLSMSSVIFNQITYSNGDTIVINMDEHQTLQLKSAGDFTGTKITSNNVVAVIVGSDSTNVGIEGGEHDYIVEQLPPRSALGIYYFLIPMPSRTIGDLIRIVALIDKTDFKFQEKTYHVAREGEFTELPLLSNTFGHIESNHPILVAQFCKSWSENDTTDTDPNMVILAPLYQFRKSYIFAVPRITLVDNAYYLVLVSSNACIQETRLDDAMISKSWNPIPNTDFSTVQIKVSEGYHSVDYVNACNELWGYIYGTANKQSWAMPIGWSFEDIIREDLPTTSVSSADNILAPSFSAASASYTFQDKTTSLRDAFSTSNYEYRESSIDSYLSIMSTSYSYDKYAYDSLQHSVSPSYTVSQVAVISSKIIELTTSSKKTLKTQKTFIPSVQKFTSIDEAARSLSISSFSDKLRNHSTKVFTTNIIKSSSSVYTFTTKAQENSPLDDRISTNATRDNNVICDCICLSIKQKQAELSKKLIQMRRNLSVDKSQISANSRKRNSMRDNRVSAQVLGYTGVSFLIVIFLVVLIPDALRTINFLLKNF